MRRLLGKILGIVLVLTIVLVLSVSYGKETVKITIWHYLNDRDKLLKTLATQYYLKTGVRVEFQLYSGDQMGAKIRAAAQARTLPDAWTGVGLKGDLSKLAQAGKIYNALGRKIA
jgi:ABC-type glycerol-3-phosphate transport system substrate-binding protein